jgi:anti-sigma-K factor RskA
VTVSARSHPLDDLAAYAVDAIDDPRERAFIESHLVTCEACRQQLVSDWSVLSGLVADESPPPYLWGAIQASTGLPPGPVVVPVDFGTPSASGAAPRTPRHHTSRRRLIALAAAAAALVAAVAAGPDLVAAFHDGGGPGSGETAQRTVGILTAADGHEVARVVESGGRTYMALDGVAVLPAGRTYQLWSLDDSRAPVSLGLLGDGADTSVAVNLPPGTTRIGISDEPEGGSPSPSGLIAGAGTLA